MKIKLTHILFILSLMVFIFIPSRHRGGIFQNVIERDTTIYNVTYRDSVVYNIEYKDSTIINYEAVPLTEFDTITLHDTTFIYLPIASYHFADSLSDIWASGYHVTLDSVRYHFRDVTKMVEREVLIRPRRLTADVGGMLIKTSDRWLLSADIRAAARINDRWSIEARAGVAAGERVMSFLGIGGRYSLR
jgi:hypothetical protein